MTLSPITRSTTYLDDPEQLLHAYIHEQLHHFSLLVDPKRTLEPFDAEIRSRYPNLPLERPAGCGSERSNYIHIEVNFLEYQSLRELLGVERATKLVAEVPFYTAIYALVLRDYDSLETLFRENHYVLPERPPEDKQFGIGQGSPSPSSFTLTTLGLLSLSAFRLAVGFGLPVAGSARLSRRARR